MSRRNKVSSHRNARNKIAPGPSLPAESNHLELRTILYDALDAAQRMFIELLDHEHLIGDANLPPDAELPGRQKTEPRVVFRVPQDNDDRMAAFADLV